MNINQKFLLLFKDTIIFALGNLGSKFILFLLVPLYTNYLTTTEYGTAELVFTISQLVIPIASVAIWNGVIRYGLKNDLHAEDVLINSLLIWFVGSCLIVLSTPVIGLYSPVAEWKWYLCVYSIVFIANQIALNYLKVKDRNKFFSIISVFQTIVLAGLNVLLLTKYQLGVSGYLVSNIAANVVSALVIFLIGGIYKDLQRGCYNLVLLRQLLGYSAPLIVNDISWWVIHSSDKIMIEWLISSSVLGLYTVAAKIPGLINTFINIFSQAWGISSVKEFESSNDTVYYSKVFEVYSALSFGAAVAFITIIKPFMLFYVGNDFLSAWRYVPLLLLAASFSAISSYYGALFGALQKSIECMWTTLIGAFVNVLLNYLLVKQFGVWGVIVGTVIAYFLISMIRLIWINSYIFVQINWHVFVMDIVIVLIQAIAVSMNFHYLLVSLVAILLFLINHSNLLLRCISLLRK